VAGLDLATQTDLAILRLTGSSVTDHGDHLVVRSPHNPGHHWGNCVVVTDPTQAGDADRWTRVFAEAFPEAGHVAVALPGPTPPEPWEARGLQLEVDDVLVSDRPVASGDAPVGYAVRSVRGDADWAAMLALDLAHNAETGEHSEDDYRGFAAARVQTWRELAATGAAEFVAAWPVGSDAMAARVGIVDCGGTARFQEVLTASGHRRHGLACHLVGAASRWAQGRGCRRWVIVADRDSVAGRLYRQLGFVPARAGHAAYRAR
jgi:GNAT superfamily N-acetyltransferase